VLLPEKAKAADDAAFGILKFLIRYKFKGNYCEISCSAFVFNFIM